MLGNYSQNLQTDVTSLAGILFLTYVVWWAQPGSSLFSLHPTTMALSQFCFLQGLYRFNAVQPKWRVTVHWMFEVIGLMNLIVGFGAIFQNKINLDKPHFVTWHGLMGVITVIVMIVQSLGGLVAKYSIPLSRQTGLLSPSFSKNVHRISGVVSVMLSLLTVLIVGKSTRIERFLYTGLVILPSIPFIYHVILGVVRSTKN